MWFIGGIWGTAHGSTPEYPSAYRPGPLLSTGIASVEKF